MRNAFNDAETTGWEGLNGTYGLPDPDDEHVLAAAVTAGAGAGAIITLNLKDFPAERLPHGIQALSPAQFAFNTVSLDPHRALQAIRQIANRSGHHGSTRTIDDLLDLLAARYQFHDATDVLRAAY